MRYSFLYIVAHIPLYLSREKCKSTPHTKRHILIHIAEGAFVVSAALSHGHKHSVCLYRRTVDGSVVVHSITSFLVFYISLIIELIRLFYELQA